MVVKSLPWENRIWIDTFNNANTIIQVPVQRVTKYPLLLSRLYKVTPATHPDKHNLKEAQTKIEAALDQMNKDAKDILSFKERIMSESLIK